MCVGKALTGGTMTLAAAVCTSELAEGIGASEAGVLMHGPTFMANPLACAVASANLDLLGTGRWRGQVNAISDGLTSGLAGLADHPRVTGVRVMGAVGVVQLDHPVDVPRATTAGLDRGVWLRPFRDLVYTMPPYLCTDDDIATITAAMAAAVEAG
jgi:adenosylmethionine-8-amino-7-oxononanoate aminotransferase